LSDAQSATAAPVSAGPRVALEVSAEPAEERELLPPAERVVRALREAHRLLPGRGLRALDRDLGKAAFLALERGNHPRVAAVDVLPDIELAGFVDECRLVGEMHRNLVMELDVLLAGADHAREPLLAITVVRPGDRQQDLGVFERI